MHKKAFSIVLLFIFFSVSLDIYMDWQDGHTIIHSMLEFSTALIILISLFTLWFKNSELFDELKNTHQALNQAKEIAIKWKQENEILLKGLSASIDKQMSDWSLTKSEKDIAFLLIKGLSLKEIASIREVSERTVRQQSISIYQKANLAGRAELSAFFLEDLLK